MLHWETVYTLSQVCANNSYCAGANYPQFALSLQRMAVGLRRFKFPYGYEVVVSLPASKGKYDREHSNHDDPEGVSAILRHRIYVAFLHARHVYTANSSLGSLIVDRKIWIC
ncbi:MAG: hypothetical protein ACI9HK_001067 [Pirellulaceae bacterium]